MLTYEQYKEMHEDLSNHLVNIATVHGCLSEKQFEQGKTNASTWIKFTTSIMCHAFAKCFIAPSLTCGSTSKALGYDWIDYPNGRGSIYANPHINRMITQEGRQEAFNKMCENIDGIVTRYVAHECTSQGGRYAGTLKNISDETQLSALVIDTEIKKLFSILESSCKTSSDLSFKNKKILEIEDLYEKIRDLDTLRTLVCSPNFLLSAIATTNAFAAPCNVAPHSAFQKPASTQTIGIQAEDIADKSATDSLTSSRL